MTERLPTNQSDTNNWGAILNAWLLVEHEAGGTHDLNTMGISETGHTHLTAEVTDLTAAAISAAATVHTHTESQISDLNHNATSIQSVPVDAAAPANGQIYIYNSTSGEWEVSNVPGALEGGAPGDAKYIIQTTNASLTNAQILANLSTGLVKNATTTGVLSIATAGTDYYSPTDFAALATGLVKSTTATGAVSIATDGADYFSPTSPRNKMWDYWDYLGGKVGPADTVTEIGTGSISWPSTTNTTNGRVQLNCGTTLNNYAAIDIGGSTICNFAIAKNPIFEVSAVIPVALNNAQEAAIYFVNADGTHYAGFHAKYGVNSGKWQTITKDGSTEELTNIDSAAAAALYKRLRCEVTSTSVIFSIDGSVVATHSANIPADPMYFRMVCIQTKASGGVSGGLAVDWRYVDADR